MELHLTHEEIKEYLTILDQKIQAHCAQAEISRNMETDMMQSGIAVGYRLARDILFNLDQISERKKQTGKYDVCNLPKCGLDWFLEEEKEKVK